MKKRMTAKTALRLDPVAAIIAMNTIGPRMPANFSHTANRAKNSADFSFGIKVANSERLRAVSVGATVV